MRTSLLSEMFQLDEERNRHDEHCFGVAAFMLLFDLTSSFDTILVSCSDMLKVRLSFMFGEVYRLVAVH